MSPRAAFTRVAADRRILDAADSLFYERGISDVGIADVRDASGVSLRRIYVIYPSKRDLTAAWLTDRHDRWMSWFTDTVERHISSGTEPVLAAFDAIREWRRSPDYRGCAFINAIAEPAEIDERHRAIVADHKRSLVRSLAALASRTRPNTPVWFADALGVLIDGAIVQSAIAGNDKPITAARKATAQLLEAMP
jgi:AcrR family transcriptional regulator